MRIHFGTPKSITTVADALSLYGREEFASATRSTVPLLSLLIHDPGLFATIVRGLGYPTEYDVFLEYTAGPFGGRGKPSHTDLMLRAGEHALAIEAKWTESMYETVRKWFGAGGENRQKVRDGWIAQLRQTYSASFDDVVYQMLHRAASASYAGKKPQLAYFLFKSPSLPQSTSTREILDELERLWNLLGDAKFPFDVVEIGIHPLPLFEGLPKAKGTGTVEAVQTALQGSEPLFDFGPVTIRRVGERSRPIVIKTEGHR